MDGAGEAAAAAAVALVLTLLGTPLAIRRLTHQQRLDYPNHRSSHDQPVPRGAGQVLAPAALAALLLFAPASVAVWGLAGAAGLFALLGHGDDVRSLPPQTRLAAQVALGAGGAIGVATVDGRLALTATLLGLLAVVAYVNAFNFMDGINGISGTQAAIVGTAFAAMGLAYGDALLTAGGAAVAGTSLGFLPYNFPRPRVFLGDVGSYFLGGWLSLLAVRACALGINPVAVALPFAVYLGDTGLTLLRRAVRREPLLEAHRDHVYQRLVRAGWSHTRTTTVVSAVSAVCSTAGVAITKMSGAAPAVMTTVATCTLVGSYLLLPWARQRLGATPESAAVEAAGSVEP